MGTLNLPAAGVVYLDTAPIIYSVEKNPDYEPLLRPLWAAAQTGQITLATSELTLLETLVGPLKNNNQSLAAAYERLLTGTGIWLLPIKPDILR